MADYVEYECGKRSEVRVKSRNDLKKELYNLSRLKFLKHENVLELLAAHTFNGWYDLLFPQSWEPHQNAVKVWLGDDFKPASGVGNFTDGNTELRLKCSDRVVNQLARCKV